jgi:DNA-binding response OmpR family regulator
MRVLLVLDRELPRVHGDGVCREIAAGPGDSRVLMLTAARSVGDRVEGLGPPVIQAVSPGGYRI